MENISEKQEKPVVVEEKGAWANFTLFFAFIWMIIGVLGFIMSLVCFAYEGTTTDKFVGLLVSIVLGPIYWIFYAFTDTGYCTSSDNDGQTLFGKNTKGKRRRLNPTLEVFKPRRRTPARR
jgi:hypothetical protein